MQRNSINYGINDVGDIIDTNQIKLYDSLAVKIEVLKMATQMATLILQSKLFINFNSFLFFIFTVILFILFLKN